MRGNRRSARDVANTRSQARTDLLTEARSLIIRAQYLAIETPTSLLSLQHDIERALRNERRARRNRERDAEEPSGAEIEEIGESAVDSEGPEEQDVTAVSEAEAEVSERAGTQSSANEKPHHQATGDATASGPAECFLGIALQRSWQAQDRNEASRLLWLNLLTTPHWPSDGVHETVIIIQSSVESINDVLRQPREGAPEPDETRDSGSSEVSLGIAAYFRVVPCNCCDDLNDSQSCQY